MPNRKSAVRQPNISVVLQPQRDWVPNRLRRLVEFLWSRNEWVEQIIWFSFFIYTQSSFSYHTKFLLCLYIISNFPFVFIPISSTSIKFFYTCALFTLKPDLQYTTRLLSFHNGNAYTQLWLNFSLINFKFIAIITILYG